MALELGATHVIDTTIEEPVAAVRKILGGEGADYSLECTGVASILRAAVDVLGVPGTCGVVGAAPFGAEVSLDINTILSGRTIRGIIEGDSVPDRFIPSLVELWRTGRFPFDKLIKHYRLDQINDAIRDSEGGSVLKPVLVSKHGVSI
jgi:aryl-alcohol dehydrogenase